MLARSYFIRLFNHIKPLYVLETASKEEKIRTLLSCFDAEILLYIDKKLPRKPAFILIFLACLRYVWKQTKLKSWERQLFHIFIFNIFLFILLVERKF